MKKNRFIVFGAFVLGGIALLLMTRFYKDYFYLVSFLMLLIAVIGITNALLDPHLNPYLRVAFLVISLLFLIGSMVGLLIKEDNMPLPIYCLILGILEIINGGAELTEAWHLLKEKNFIWIPFALDALFEVVLGILMVIERDETLRFHTTLISIDLMVEGTLKLINEFVEDKRRSHEQ